MTINRVSTLLLFVFIQYFHSYAQVDQYRTVVFGEQTWMSTNLNVSVFRNGDSIPQAKTNEEWIKAGKEKKPAWCYYMNDPLNGTKYGKLYNWYAVNDSRGLAPEGWHIPNDKEWANLTVQMGGVSGKKMKSTKGWKDYVSDGIKKTGNGTNESGFNVLPCGTRDKTFGYINELSGFWCINDNNIYSAWYVYFFFKLDYHGSNYGPKEDGLSVRCIKNQQ
jgi:uncharacterized protein (TIGR02145 family)